MKAKSLLFLLLLSFASVGASSSSYAFDSGLYFRALGKAASGFFVTSVAYRLKEARANLEKSFQEPSGLTESDLRWFLSSLQVSSFYDQGDIDFAASLVDRVSYHDYLKWFKGLPKDRKKRVLESWIRLFHSGSLSEAGHRTLEGTLRVIEAEDLQLYSRISQKVKSGFSLADIPVYAFDQNPRNSDITISYFRTDPATLNRFYQQLEASEFTRIGEQRFRYFFNMETGVGAILDSRGGGFTRVRELAQSEKFQHDEIQLIGGVRHYKGRARANSVTLGEMPGLVVEDANFRILLEPQE